MLEDLGDVGLVELVERWRSRSLPRDRSLLRCLEGEDVDDEGECFDAVEDAEEELVLLDDLDRDSFEGRDGSFELDSLAILSKNLTIGVIALASGLLCFWGVEGYSCLVVHVEVEIVFELVVFVGILSVKQVFCSICDFKWFSVSFVREGISEKGEVLCLYEVNERSIVFISFCFSRDSRARQRRELTLTFLAFIAVVGERVRVFFVDFSEAAGLVIFLLSDGDRSGRDLLRLVVKRLIVIDVGEFVGKK